MSQIDIFSLLYDKPVLSKDIHLIELFGGYGSQHLSLNYLGIPPKKTTLCEWAVKSIQAYKDIHYKSDNTDYSKDLTDDEILDYLVKKGVSIDYNKPAKREQVKRLDIRTIYNNIIATHNLVNIEQVHYKDLGVDSKLTNIMTYSFPCQDLSLAGKRAGIKEGTRSGMLFQVERILRERESNCEPPIQILLMENVPQVLSEKEAWYSWCSCLESLGYTNYCKVINAKDYKIPQNRKRCFMLSIYGNYSYEFPEKLGLDIRLKDILEKQVDEKYYLSDKMIRYIEARFPSNTEKITTGIHIHNENTQESAGTITTSAGNRATDNYIIDKEHFYDKSKGKIVSKNGIEFQTKGTKQLNETLEQNEINEGDSLDLYNRSVHSGIIQTLDTGYHNSQRVVVKSSERECLMIKNATKQGYLEAKAGDGIDLENGTRKGRRGTVQKGLSQTLKTQDSVGVCVGTYNYAKSNFFIGDGSRMRIGNDISETILASGNQAGVVLKTELCNKLVREGQVEEGDVVKHSFTQQILDGKKKAVEKQDEMITLTTRGDCFGVAVKDEIKLLGGVGEKKSNGGTQYYEQDRVYSSEGIATANASVQPYYNSGLRIRKLTCRECFSLMGVKQADYEKITNSDSSKYHLAGDSIVTTCLMAIFGKLFDLDYKDKIQEVVDDIIL